ncbi:DUF2786 domain-containing protein [Dactylosporangium matsuzakiense]|uniref:DUF2786 domain-containing protein n=1 Tax=Dactylosporangium matsuzakiense TaxID=53360 RepID=A0A9W6NMC2_9ACTN|nr:DUF2786 domain-containing protein [Dactylosporangium matsuzakiense]GLL02066.1 hypothetical protein GCM10017581_038080 [Dactylosporangium matsuzakiense]
MLDKVRKLLAKAEDPACTPEEAEALTAKAAMLIAKYGIDQALIDARTERNQAVGNRLVELTAPYLREKAYLLHVVAAALRCRSIRLERRTTDGLRVSVHLFGFESDVAGVELLFASLLVQAARGLLRESIPPGQQPAAWRRSWLIGFGSAVQQRFAAATAQAEDPPPPGTALVLADRERAVDLAVEAEYPNVQAGRRRRLTGGGFEAGNTAGHRADLGAVRVETRPRAQVTGRP